MNTFTKAEASELICPETISSGVNKTCWGKECVAFTETGQSTIDWMTADDDSKEGSLYYCGRCK